MKFHCSKVTLVTVLFCMLQGRIFPFDPCGRAFVTVPLEPRSATEGECLITALDLLIETLTNTVSTYTYMAENW